jgi:putative membrane-bound dehydrogenase-like protein
MRRPVLRSTLTLGLSATALLAFAVVLAANVSRGLHAQDTKVPGENLAEQMKRLPAVEAKDAIKTFSFEKGFTFETFAAEPAVGDPVDACFDENGRMFVAEFHAYPYSAEKREHDPTGRGKKESGIIRMLEDTDGDGKADRSVVFADKLDWPLSVAPYNGGLFVIDPPHLYYFKDTNGDDVADEKRIVFSGFSRFNVQGVANNLKWGLDNRIWAATGSNPANLTKEGMALANLGRRDWAFDPRTEKLEPTTGGIQYGHSMDDWGNRFVCSNSVHIIHCVFEEKYLARNPYFAAPGGTRSIAKEGGAGPVFRRSPPEPWRLVRTARRVADPKFAGLPANERVPIGFFTSATGVTIYRGDAYPEEYRGNAFVGDVGGNLIHRKTLTPTGATFLAVRADENTEFVASTDTWFRPVNFVNAPDGTLFVLDMYRETIEHPISIPEDIKAFLDLESGNDRGRIYRLVSPDMKRKPVVKLGKASVEELVANLESTNAWNRQTAQRLLWERQEKSAVPSLIKLAKESKNPLGRLHALYTLSGLQALTPQILVTAMSDPHPGIREHAARISEPFLKLNAVAVALIGLATDSEFRPKFQAALSMGYVPGESGIRGMTTLAKNLTADPDLRTAFLTSVTDNAASLTVSLLKDGEFLKTVHARGLLSELARIVGARPEDAGALTLLAAVTGADCPSDVRPLMLQGLGEGLGRRGMSLSKLLKSSNNADVTAQTAQFFANALATARDEAQQPVVRRPAVSLLAFADFGEVSETLEQLLSPQQPQELQSAAIAALSAHDDPTVPKIILGAWKGYGPKVRAEATDALLARIPRIEALLAALTDGKVKRAEVDREKKQLLLNHPNKAISGRAKELFSGELGGNRVKVVADFQPVLELAADATRGKEVFTKKCSQCHKLGDMGHQVGPDLTSTQNKSPSDLLIAILDPNREAQAAFIAYTAVTVDGETYTGLVATESAGSITLRRGEGKEDTILRNRIDVLASQGLSLMPEGLEKELDKQQLADVIAFVKSLKKAN